MRITPGGAGPTRESFDTGQRGAHGMELNGANRESARVEIVVELIAMRTVLRPVVALGPSWVRVRVASGVSDRLTGFAARLRFRVRVDIASLVWTERLSDIVVVTIAVAVGALACHEVLSSGVGRNR